LDEGRQTEPTRSLGREPTVQVDKEAVAAALREQGDHDRAQQAECRLPRHVDTERDAALLHLLDVDVHRLDADTT
jgi:hypothetical protein